MLYREGRKQMKAIQISKVYNAIIRWRDFRFRIFGEGILVGIIVGCVISSFRWALEKAEISRHVLYQYLKTNSILITVFWFLGLLAISSFLTYLGKKEPMASGSGIPQVKGVIAGQMKTNWLKILIVKFIGGVVAIGSGLSLGREGPSVQLGAVVGQGVSRNLTRTRMEEKYLMTSGSSAGLAAAFNAPLAGVIFALEELHKNFSSVALTSAVAAALSATFVSQEIFGDYPVFQFPELLTFPLSYYGILLVSGFCLGWVGVLFHKGIFSALDFYEKKTWPVYLGKAVFPLILAGILGFFLPEVLGGGNQLVDMLAKEDLGFYFLWALLLAKFSFTMFSYGSGVPGGIFLPMLVIGALVGSLLSKILIIFGFLPSEYGVNLIVLSMAGLFSAIVKAPITGSVLIMEMTGSFNHMLSLIVISMAAFLVVDAMKISPIYEALLDRSLNKNKHSLKHINNENRIVLEVTVQIGSKLDGKYIKDIDWPKDALLVSIKRGENEIVPVGDTCLFPGDFIYIMVYSEQYDYVQKLANCQDIKI